MQTLTHLPGLPHIQSSQLGAVLKVPCRYAHPVSKTHLVVVLIQTHKHTHYTIRIYTVTYITLQKTRALPCMCVQPSLRLSFREMRRMSYWWYSSWPLAWSLFGEGAYQSLCLSPATTAISTPCRLVNTTSSCKSASQTTVSHTDLAHDLVHIWVWARVWCSLGRDASSASLVPLLLSPVWAVKKSAPFWWGIVSIRNWLDLRIKCIMFSWSDYHDISPQKWIYITSLLPEHLADDLWSWSRSSHDTALFSLGPDQCSISEK